MATTAPIIVTDVLDITEAVANSSTSIDTVNRPLSNVLDRVHPLRTFRTSDASGAANATVEIGAKTIVGVFLDNFNFSAVDIKTKQAGGAENATIVANHSLTKDVKTGRYKAYIDFTENGHPTGFVFNGTTHDKLMVKRRVGSTNVAESSFAGSEFGSITVVEQGNQLLWPGGHINDLEYAITDPQVSNTFEGGGIEPISVGELYVELEIPNITYVVSTQENIIMQILRNRTSPIIFYENNGKPEQAYTMRLSSARANKASYSVSGTAFNINLTFIETV
jgi:hypothetical protein